MKIFYFKLFYLLLLFSYYYCSQNEVEVYNYKYHRCYNHGEAYSASFLMTTYNLITTKTNHNLTWVNCEMGSMIFFGNQAKPGAAGSIVQSRDIFDLSVIHLSAYERLIKRHTRRLPKKQKTLNVTDKMTSVSDNLKYTYQQRHQSILTSNETLNEILLHRLNRTVAAMPFLGYTNGAGHSVLSNRFSYLKACFWSIYAYIPHIIVTVNSEADYNYCRYKSNLPFYDVLYLNYLPKPASLPVATSKEVKARLMNGTYKFDYYYYTESDQVLIVRQFHQLYSILDIFPRYVLVPHRLIPYPDNIMSSWVQRPLIEVQDHKLGWMNKSCCIPQQRCQTRESWVNIRDIVGVNNSQIPSYPVPIFPMFELNVALGNSNFLDEKYRSCKYLNITVDKCDN